MKWNEICGPSNKTTFETISTYISNELWEKLYTFIEYTYKVKPKIEYSSCTLAPGWNIKYKKSNKSICTIYPHEDYYTCMVTVGNKNQSEIEYMIPSCDKYVQDIYRNTSSFNGNKWLMIDITNNEILENVKEIISIKMKY